MADRDELSLFAQSSETPQPAAGDVFQEDALDRLARAEVEDLLERWPLDQSRRCRGR